MRQSRVWRDSSRRTTAPVDAWCATIVRRIRDAVCTSARSAPALIVLSNDAPLRAQHAWMESRLRSTRLSQTHSTVNARARTTARLAAANRRDTALARSLLRPVATRLASTASLGFRSTPFARVILARALSAPSGQPAWAPVHGVCKLGSSSPIDLSSRLFARRISTELLGQSTLGRSEGN